VTVQLSLKMDLPSDWFTFQPASQDDENLVADGLANLHRSLEESGYARQTASLEMLKSAISNMFSQLSLDDVRLAGVCLKQVRVRGVETGVSASMTAAVRPIQGSLSPGEARAVLDEVGGVSRSLYANADYDQSLLTMSGVDALRMSWRSSQLSAWTGESQPCRILQFILPLVDEGAVVVVTFETANVEFYEDMAPVFEGIAGTLETTSIGSSS